MRQLDLLLSCLQSWYVPCYLKAILNRAPSLMSRVKIGSYPKLTSFILNKNEFEGSNYFNKLVIALVVWFAQWILLPSLASPNKQSVANG